MAQVHEVPEMRRSVEDRIICISLALYSWEFEQQSVINRVASVALAFPLVGGF